MDHTGLMGFTGACPGYALSLPPQANHTNERRAVRTWLSAAEPFLSGRQSCLSRLEWQPHGNTRSEVRLAGSEPQVYNSLAG